jgi:arsenate reductase
VPINLVRTQDKNFKALNIDINKLNNEEIIDLIIKNPKILERPIILKKESGVIGRPPDNVKMLF